ncbi:hypothetical protein G6F66_003072 [Rhizopus arrhizus]|nr:hypothetical protein G6F66_003072 [Rhizopus arrhizus]
MLHELLFVLSGYPGDVFVPSPTQVPTTFAIPPGFPLLHSAERDSLNRFGQLGWTYSQINDFVTSTKDLKLSKQPSETNNKPHGAYIQALLTCIETTLNEYRHDILEIEKSILNKEDDAGLGVVPISLIAAKLTRWELLLPSLWKFVRLLQTDPEKYHGCRLFNLLMDQVRTGVLEYRKEMEKIIEGLYDVLYRQLSSWMVYGHCVDHYNEFFIVPCNRTAATVTTGWNRLYTIASDRVPDQLALSVVESVLFVGKAIATVNEIDKMPSTATINTQDEDILLNSKLVRTVAQTRKIPIPEGMRKKHLDLLLTLHSSRLQQLPSMWVQYPQLLQNVVNQVRRSTSDWLFSQVLIGDHGLHRYLSSFRHIFLLSFGEWASNFIEECFAWRKRSSSQFNRSKPKEGSTKDSNKTALIFRHQELNALLLKSSLNTDVEGRLSGYSLWVENEQTKNFVFSDMLLGKLGIVLTFSLEWPIDLFINENHLKVYSNLWSFLISLKCTQTSLNNLWKSLRTSGYVNQDEKHPVHASNINLQSGNGYQERLVWRLRSLMLFWIDTLWNHLQAHVISFHYDQLIDVTTLSDDTTPRKRRSRQIKTKLDFEEIQEAHEKFLENIERGCLLTSEECVETMHLILTTCSSFCELMERLTDEGEWRINKRRRIMKTAAEIVNNWTDNETTSFWLQDIEHIQEEFKGSTEKFFNLASSQPPEIKSSGKIDILLLQLDYNKWFSNPYS